MLDEVMTAAAAAGGIAVVEAAGSDLWASFRTRCARLVGRGDPDREGEALEQLDRTAARLASGEDKGEREWQREVQARVWRVEFAALLESVAAAERDELLAGLVALRARAAADETGGAVSGNTFRGPVAFQTGARCTQDIRFGAAG
ncbi:hypothetical protein [Streptomyces sp. NBC_01334]|uniref:hypothetical protein n=1 Tax=Streptomyces sp. NBC_01334 TaxID=2903827 RepID=UPI002E134DCA|nr:hypothetical protein OG736_04430 [Streptomyces sp. NBC_01334]